MTKRRTYRVNADLWTVLRDILEYREDFNSDKATLRGRNWHGTTDFETGMLPQSECNQMKDSVVTYIVYSYQTPIAYRRIADWNTNGTANYEWIVPGVSYSVTTTKHQGRVRTAISQLRED